MSAEDLHRVLRPVQDVNVRHASRHCDQVSLGDQCIVVDR